MIRHGSSFFLSLTFHTILFILLFFTWQNIPAVKKMDCEEKLCVQLCKIVSKKPVVKPAPMPKPEPKKIVKQKVEPKPIVKKIEIVKEEPVVIPEVEEEIAEVVQEEVIVASEEVVEPIQRVATIQIVEEEIILEDTGAEDTEAKEKRLEEEYLQEHIDKITKLLQENLYYPRRARKRGTVGEVMVRFKLSLEATAHSIEVLSSKSEILSRAAIKTIEDLSGEFPKPYEELTLHVPINYELK